MEADIGGRIEMLREIYAQMVREIPGLLDARLEQSCMPLAQYQLALVAVFESIDALAEYQVHPLHQKLRELSQNWVCGRAVFDSEIDEKNEGDAFQ